jgi:hypothetical protein
VNDHRIPGLLDISGHAAAHVAQSDKSYGFHLCLLNIGLMTGSNYKATAIEADYILGDTQAPPGPGRPILCRERIWAKLLADSQT